MTPSSSLRDKILADAAAQRARTRSQGRRRAALVYTIAALAGLPLFFLWGGLSHAGGRPTTITVGVGLGALLLAVACAAVAFRRGKSLVGRSSTALLSVAVVAPIATYAWLVSWHARYVDPFARVGYRCLTMTLVAGAALLGAALFLRKRTIAVHASAAGAALGAAAGTFGGVTVDVWCPISASSHVLVGHVLPLVILSATGAIVGRMILPIRAR
ncbi:MAG TPA: NrsF family protein [Polyangiaceae bacterium]|jgi:hypothetical protein